MNSLALNAGATYRARLRFRIPKKLGMEEVKFSFNVADHEVLLSTSKHEQPIKDSAWLIMNATGFTTETEASCFCHKLRAAIELSSVATRLGLDAGRDLSTFSLASFVTDEIYKTNGSIVRENIHGIDIFVDDPNVTFLEFYGTLAPHNFPSAEAFLLAVDGLFEESIATSEKTKDIILLLNYALMRPEPVAQIVFAFSAVEMLGQNETWTANQKSLLRELIDAALVSSVGSDSERSEVAEALKKSIHRLSLRQGVMRLLDRLNLAHLKLMWDQLYAERSTLVHGLAPRDGADYSDLANKTVSLCGHILLTATAREASAVKQYVERFYAIPANFV